MAFDGRVLLLLIAVIGTTFAVEPAQYDVIVVGGGLSGMTAAYELSKFQGNISVLLLEAQNRLGGRTFSVDMPGPNGTDRFDLGGQWVGKTQYYIMYMLNELGIATYAQYINGDKKSRMTVNGTISSYQGDGLRMSLLGTQDVLKLLRDVEDYAKRVGPTAPMGDSQSADWNRISVGEFAQRAGWTQQNRVALNVLCDILFDTKPEQISMLYFLMLLNSTGGSLDTLTRDDTYGAMALRINNGAQTLVDAMARSVPNIRNYRQVTRVSTMGDMVEVETKEGDVKHARYVIMAVPPNMAADIRFQPPLSNDKVQLLRNYVPKGKGFKFVFTYSTAWWRSKNLAGQVLSTAQTDSTSTDPPLPSVITYDGVSARGTPALMGFADFGHDYSKETRRQAYLGVMEQFFGDDVNHFLGFSDEEWSKDAYSRGCVATLAPGRMPANFSALIRAPTNDRVFWAGTETATAWAGYMNGAVQAGRFAAGDVLDKYKIPHSLHIPLNHSPVHQLSKTLFAIVTVISLMLLLI